MISDVLAPLLTQLPNPKTCGSFSMPIFPQNPHLINLPG